jgi:HAD superfamily hydrolase (TIGR01509 family)
MGSSDALIFDCDGTLVDSEAILLEVVIDQARALGLADISPAEMRAWKGRSMASGMKALSEALGRPLPADFEDKVRARMADIFSDRLRPMPGAAEMLARLRVPFCVASNGPRHKTELTLGLTGLRHLFEGRIFSAYDVGSFKPDPGLFLHAARAMGVAPERCAVVEDSEPGARAGLAAGMKVFVLRSAHALPWRGGSQRARSRVWMRSASPAISASDNRTGGSLASAKASPQCGWPGDFGTTWKCRWDARSP